jgi:outer membrane biosynthesis protein TonB
MPAAIGPRFVLEAGFLILLAVVAGLAELSPVLIVLVMAVGWLLVALIEYSAWRQTSGFPAVQRVVSEEAAPEPPPVHEEMVEEPTPPPPPPPPVTPPPEEPPPEEPPPPEEETLVAEPQADAPLADAEEVIDFLPEHDIPHRLDPLKPRPSRRWIIFGPRTRREDDREEER